MNDTFVVGALYAVFLCGVALAFQKSFLLLFRSFSARHRLSVKNRHAGSLNPVLRHLHYLLGATMEKPCSPSAFVGGCAAVMTFLVILSLKSFHPFTALLMGGACASAPYLFLRIRLETRRRRGSMEGEKIVSELLRQYRICDKNIYESLERLIPQVTDCKVCCRLLHRMLLRLRNTGNPLEIREAVGMFSFAVGTNWSHMLAGSVRLAAERGYDVSMGLEDILVQMRQARGRLEERKRMNSEAVRLTLVMVPLLYLSTALLSVYYLEVPLPKFLQNQLGTPEGMLLFLFIIFLFVLNLALIEMVNNQKMDY